MKLFLKKELILFLIISIGIFFRIYNLNFDNLWYDEIISFWVANPSFSYQETSFFHNQIETTSILYNLILKSFYQIFGYSAFNGRLLSAVISILSIFSIIYLDKQINKNYSYIFSAFLISLNIFLIGYSQELRNYSLFFLTTSLTLIYFIKYSDNTNNIRNLFIFSIILFINILVHPYGLILLFSIFFYELLKAYFKKKTSILMIASLIIILMLSSIFYYQLFVSTSILETDYWGWLKNPSLSFYTNFYFSNYFGSRLVGGIHLLILIFLIIKNFSEIKKINYLSLFLIIILFSYIIPILFGYLLKPTILPRYVMFNLIPIILLISTLAFRFESKKIKLSIIAILSLLTIGNHLTEQTIKQIYQTREASKPEYVKAINHISESNFNKYSIKVKNMKDNISSINAIRNYVNYLSQDLIFIDINKQNIRDVKFWFLCTLDINSSECKIPVYYQNHSKLLEQKQFNSIILKLIEIKK